jgi:putative transposase
MYRAFKYRLYPTPNQVRELEIALNTHRHIYNAALLNRQMAYQIEHRSLSYEAQSRWFKGRREENPWFAKTNFSSVQATLRRLDRAFEAFFRRVKVGQKPGYPRFKGRDYFNSVVFPSYRDGVRLTDSRLYVQHIGKIKVKLHRPIEGAIKTVTVLREADKWYAVFACDLGDVAVPQKAGPEIGIDVGLEHFLTDSDGVHEPNPRYLKEALPELRRAGRSVSRKKKGGHNRRKAVKQLQAVYAKVRHCREDHRHKTALSLVRRAGLIAVERLNIKGMMGNRRLARAIADVAWAAFLATLQHKAERAGVVVVEVDPRGTSQTCSRCGTEVRKELSVRWHDCVCGLSIHRDHNAALNILAKARQVRTVACGA